MNEADVVLISLQVTGEVPASVRKWVHPPIPQIKKLELSLVGPNWSGLGHVPTPNQSM